MVGSIAEHTIDIAVAVGHTVVEHTAAEAYIPVGHTVVGHIAVEHIAVVVGHTVADYIGSEVLRKLGRHTMHLEQIAVVAVGMVMFCMDYCEVELQQRVVGSMAYVVCHKSHVTGSMAPVG